MTSTCEKGPYGEKTTTFFELLIPTFSTVFEI